MESEREDELYEAFLDGLLAGERIGPAEFLAARGAVSTELRERLDRLHRAMVEREARAARAPVGRDAAPGMPWVRLGEFRLLERLGEGGMGVVFLAEQEPLGRLVALKVVRPELVGSPTTEERFRREALAVAKLRHPNVVRLFTVGEDHGVRYAVFELAPGRGLDEIYDEAARSGTPLPAARVVAWGLAIARALEHAHAHGILHRDVKPSNVRIAPDGAAMLMDFGLAREVAGGSPTITDRFTGSPAYASPEQLTPERTPGPATDVFSLGVVLYEGLTARSPFAADSLERVFQRVIALDPPPPHRLVPGLPRDLSHVVLKAMEKAPERRYASAAELALDLEAVLALRPVSARAPSPVRRVTQWAGRHRATAATLFTGVAALVGLSTILAVQRVHARGELARLAREAVTAARELRASTPSGERELTELARSRWLRYLSPEEDAELAAGERARAEREHAVDQAFQAAIDRIGRAEEGGLSLAATKAMRAELYLDRFRDALSKDDERASLAWRDLVRANDPEARLASELEPRGWVSIASRPSGASVHLLRYVELNALAPGGDRRLVPVPIGPPDTVADVESGSLALRVARGAGELERGDLVVSLDGHPVGEAFLVRENAGLVAAGERLQAIGGQRVREDHDVLVGGLEGAARAFTFLGAEGSHDVTGTGLAALGIRVDTPRALAERGGARARVLHGTQWRELALPEGVQLRYTAAPSLPTAACCIGSTPIERWELEQGSYLARITCQGYEPASLPFFVRRGEELALELELLAEGTTPEGFARVDDGRPDDPEPFWMQEREVTFGDWIEFLEDEETHAAVSLGAGPPLLPSGAGIPADTIEEREGRFVVSDDLDASYPVFGVSWHAAMAYAAWRTRVSGLEERGLVLDLATRAEWLLAFAGGLPRRFPFGDVLNPKWIKCRFSRSYFRPESVMSFPIDESPYGVFDMTGSISEWCQDVFARPSSRVVTQTVSGGSFNHPAILAYEPESTFARETGSVGLPAEQTGTFLGFRLVLRQVGSAEDRGR